MIRFTIKKLISFLLIALLSFGCTQIDESKNKFSSTSDTLIIQTKKQRGRGLFTSSAVELDFNDSIGNSASDFNFPGNLTDIKFQHMPTDFSPGNSNFIEMITGMMGNSKVFVIDENNNKNLSDDSVRLLKKLRWYSTDGIVKCRYLVFDGEKSVEDSSWFQLREDDDGTIWFGRKEHRVAELTLDNDKYKIGVTDLFSGFFSYGTHSWIAILSEFKSIKDTLRQKDILNIGEYLALGSGYYRFEKISVNGEFITLIKDENFADHVGTQVGMLAPGFICRTVSGDTISSLSLHDRILVIANSCECGDDQDSKQAYYDIRTKYHDNIYLIRLDSKLEKKLDGLQIDVQDDFNKDIYYKYRKEYCSRMCFVINKNNRIIDKFPVTAWKSNLPSHIDSQSM